jgi:hypothetical protein
MRELQLRVESPRVVINGQPFDLLLDDVEIFTRAQALFAECESFFLIPRTAQEALAATRGAIGLLEAILGVGAARAISASKPVSLTLTLEWLSVIARDCADHYVEEVMEDV